MTPSQTHERPIHQTRAACLAVMAALLALAPAALGQLIPIATPDDLDKIRNNLDGDYIQIADIDLVAFPLAPIGSDTDPFTGTYDGNGFTILNFSYDGFSQGHSFVGLFGATSGAALHDMTLKGIDVTGINRVGGLAGQTTGGTITDCEVGSSTLGTQPSLVVGVIGAGGMIGRVHGSTVERCISRVNSHCYDRWSGSLIGHIHLGSTVRNCQAYGKATGGKAVGGLTGNIHGSLVENCHAFGDVVGTSVCGGLTGYFQEDLSGAGQPSIARGCTASGDVTSTASVLLLFTDPNGNTVIAIPSNGGIAGWLDPGSIVERCRASGGISSPDTPSSDTTAGGLVGFATTDCLITRCAAIGEIKFGNTAGGLVGWAQDDTIIEHSTASGNVNSEWQSGGLVGACERATVRFCTASGDVFARGVPGGHAEDEHLSAAVGGLVGYTFPSGAPGQQLASQIHCSSAHGNVSSTGQMTGGLVGLCWGTLITECYATGNVTSTDRRLGGLVGATLANTSGPNSFPDPNERSEIYDCYATGTVTQNAERPEDEGLVGGLVGLLDAENDILNRVENCYSAGLVTPTGPTIGGMIGDAEANGVIISSYWDLETSGQPTSDGGVGKTTAEMMQQATFVNWDFGSIWDIIENVTYPFLRCPN